MMRYPALVLSDIPDLRLTDEMQDCLGALGDESIGPEGSSNTGGQYL